MKKNALIFCLMLFSLWSLAQNAIITGKVMDDAGEVLIGANVSIIGSTNGTVTDIDGKYSLSVSKGTHRVLVSYVGYADMEKEVNVDAGENLSLDFSLEEGQTFDAIIVSGSKRPEKLTESAATIETIFAREIEQYAGNPTELLARQKGVEYFRAGIANPAINIRGFNSNFNAKNLQVTDGRISTLIATGLPFGSLSTSTRDDLERIEVILGPNATLYGPNAHNGLVNSITKDPRTSEGTTLALNGGVNGDGNGLFSVRGRYAKKLSDKFAFKIMAEYTKAEEFEYADSVFIDSNADGIKEGFEELELDNTVDFIKTEAALYYSPTDNSDIIFNWGRSNSNFLSPTNVGRNQIKDWRINYYQLRYTSDHWFAQVYYTQSKTDSTYSIDERTKQYYRLLGAGLGDAAARGEASYASGAIFQDDSRRWNAEVQYNNTFGALEVILGAQWQQDKANSLGTYLLDRGADDFIDVNQTGVYAHLNYNFGDGFKLIASARADNHEVYDFNFIPKFGLLKINDKGTWRFTYGQGIAAPTILNLYGNLISGLILGNAEGFTLADGSKVEKQKVEKIQTFELGYRGQLTPNKFFIDANAYYNITKDFLSPLTIIGVATHRGETPIAEVQSGFAIFNGLVGTYVNFGEVNTYGFDLGLNYYFTPEISGNFNYSYFDYSVDEDNLENDFNKDGVVNFLDILVNAPKHKMGAGLNYSSNKSKFFGSIYGRWVQEYDYFSSFQIASKTHQGINYRGFPIVENAKSGDTWNYGPLGGFVTVDLNFGYKLSDNLTLSAAAVNLFNKELREFTASAPTRGIYTVELKAKF
jgi:iron complex outermembrane receptor protein